MLTCADIHRAGSIQGSSSGAGAGAGGSSRLTSQATQQTPKRPQPSRRASTQAPHRGEVFSVDDGPNEVEADTRQHRSHSKVDVHPGREWERQLRRRESTVRRRLPPPTPSLPRVESHETDEEAETTGADGPSLSAAKPAAASPEAGQPSSEETLQGDDEEEEEEETPSPDDDDSADLSDAESFTLKDRQEAINETHPFGP